MIGTVTTLVERDRQFDVLARLLRDPTGAIALIEGEAGMGKSVLLAEATRALPERVRVWAGRCEPLVIPAPFSALWETLEQLPPRLADVLRAGESAIDVYAAVLDEIRRIPTAILLDDLQWADAATAGLMRYLGRRIGGTPCALVLAYRADDVAADSDAATVIAELGRAATRIDLEPLSITGVTELAAELAPERAVDAADLQRATGGNPLFVVEVLRHTAGEVPATVGEIVLGQVRRLPVATHHIVEALALCPEGLHVDIASRLSADAAAHIDLACQRRVLALDRQHVRCRHELIRGAIDAAIPPMRRRQLHRELVTVLEPVAANDRDIATLAYHSAAAGDAPRAVTYSLRAAADAVAAGTHRHAADHLTRALEFRDAIAADDLDRVLADAATELVMASRYDEATEVAKERVSLARDMATRAEALAQLGFCHTRRGGYAAGQRYAERALALAAEAGTQAPAVAQRLLAGTALEAGRWDDVIEFSLAALATSEAAGDTDACVAALTNTGTAYHVVGDPRWEEYYRRAFRMATAADLHDRAAHVFSNHANCLLAHYRLAESRRWFAEAIDFCDGREIDSWRRPLAAGSARLELVAGDWNAARAHLDTAPWGDGCWGSQAEAQGVLALLALRTTGDDGGALGKALDLADTSATHWDRVDAATLTAEAAWLGAVDPGVASRRLVAALGAPGVTRDPWACGRLAFWARRLGRDAARAVAGAGLPALPGPFAELAQPEREASEWERIGCPYEAALARAAAPQPDVQRVTAMLDALGAHAALTAVRRDWRSRGVAVRTAAITAHPSGLTDRQLDVLALVAEGHTNAEIAARLYISEKTAGHHVSAILTRLGVGSRRAARALAVERGWV